MKNLCIIVFALGNSAIALSQTPSIKEIDDARPEILKEYIGAPTEVYMLFDSIEILVRKVTFNGTELLFTDNSTNTPLTGMFVITKSQNIFLSPDIWNDRGFLDYYEIAIFSKDWKELQLHSVNHGSITNQVSLKKIHAGTQAFGCTISYVKGTFWQKRVKIKKVPIDKIVDFKPIEKRSTQVFHIIISKLDVFAILSREYPAELVY